MKELFDNIKNIFINPKNVFGELKSKDVELKNVFQDYLLIICAIPAVATFLGWFGSYRFPLGKSLYVAVVYYIFIILGVLLTAILIKFISNKFGVDFDQNKILMMSAIYWTPYIVLSILNILPRISILSIIGVFYGIYLIYLSTTHTMDMVNEKKTPFSVIIGLAILILWYLLRLIYFWGRFRNTFTW